MFRSLILCGFRVKGGGADREDVGFCVRGVPKGMSDGWAPLKIKTRWAAYLSQEPVAPATAQCCLSVSIGMLLSVRGQCIAGCRAAAFGTGRQTGRGCDRVSL